MSRGLEKRARVGQNSRKHFTGVIDELHQISRGREKDTMGNFFKNPFLYWISVILDLLFSVFRISLQDKLVFLGCYLFLLTLTKYTCVLFARVAIIKYHSLVGFNNRNLFSYSCRDQESKIKVSGGLVSSKASLLLQMASFSCVLICPFLCMHISRCLRFFL